jgi:gas vesicle protein
MRWQTRDDEDEMDEEPYLIVERQEGPQIGPFLIGLALGAGIALLLAPKSGEDTRREIADGVKRAREAAVDAVEGITETVAETLNGARNKVSEGIESARDAVDLRRRQVSSAVEAGRVAARQAREDLELRLAESKAAHKDS